MIIIFNTFSNWIGVNDDVVVVLLWWWWTIWPISAIAFPSSKRIESGPIVTSTAPFLPNAPISKGRFSRLPDTSIALPWVPNLLTCAPIRPLELLEQMPIVITYREKTPLKTLGKLNFFSFELNLRNNSKYSKKDLHCKHKKKIIFMTKRFYRVRLVFINN